MDQKELLKSELIGKYVAVVESSNKSLKNTKGKIIDETKNFFIINTITAKNSKQKIKKTIKKVLKNQCVFEFNKNGNDNEDDNSNENAESNNNSHNNSRFGHPQAMQEKIRVNGKNLAGRPEDRIKMKVKNGKK